MIKCETNNGKLELDVKGNLFDISADSAYIITHIYRTLFRKNKQQAKEYKRLVMLTFYKMCDEIDAEY